MGTLIERAAKGFLIVGMLLALSVTQVSAATNPFDWFLQGGGDMLNYEATGPNGDYWTVSNLMGGVGWNNTNLISTQYADVAYPGQYIPQDNSLAIGGDTTVRCTSNGCRNHTRLWGIPYSNSTDSIQSASTEHWPGGFTHIVDSFNDGRDGVYTSLWSYSAITSGWYTQQYGGGCIGQGDGSCAPYDGLVAYENVDLSH